MSPISWYAPVAATAAALGSMTALVLRTRPLRHRPSRRGPLPVSVVIAARNEADKLGLLLDDLAAQRRTVPLIEIIVVDDESADGTAALAAAGGALVVSSSPRPLRWNPKVWALWLGSAHAHHGELVFLDADVRLAPGALAAVVGARRQAGGLLSVAPHHLAGGAVESLSAAGNVVAVAGGGPGLGRRAIGAVGSCLAISRADYDAIGGHGAHPATIVDDLDLAAAARAAGLPVTLLRGGALVTMRSYPDGLRSLVAGWSKNLAAGLTRTPVLRGLAVALWIAALVLPLALLAQRQWLLGAALWSVVALHTAWLTSRVGRFSPLVTTVGAPVLGLFITGLTLRSVLAAFSGGRIDWKGRALGADGLEADPVDSFVHRRSARRSDR